MSAQPWSAEPRWFHHDFAKDLSSLWHSFAWSSPTLLIFLVHVCIAPRIRNEIYIRLDQPILPLTYRSICLRKRAMEESFQRLHRVCLLLHRGIRYHCDALESSRQLRATVTGNGRSSIFPISHLDFSNYGSLSFLHIYIYICTRTLRMNHYSFASYFGRRFFHSIPFFQFRGLFAEANGSYHLRKW